MKRQWQALILTVTLLGASCGGGDAPAPKKTSGAFPKEKLSLTIWSDANDKVAYEQATSDYTQEHPNVTFKYKKLDSATYETELLNALAAGKGPDIATLPNDFIPRYQDKLVAMPTKLFGTSINPVTIMTSQYAPAVKTDLIQDGKVYGIPLYADTLVLYRNPNLVEKIFQEYIDRGEEVDSDLFFIAPANWTSLVELTKLVTKRSGTTIERSAIALGTSANVPFSADIIAALLLQQGASMVAPDKKSANFHLADQRDPSFYPGEAVLNFLRGFAVPATDPDADYYTWNAEMPDAAQAFMDGKVAMMINYRPIQSTIRQRKPGLSFEVTPLPQIKDALKIVDFTRYRVDAVTNNSKYPEVAWDFLKIYLEDDEYSNLTGRASPLSIGKTTIVSQRVGVTDPYEYQVGTAQSWYKGKEPKLADQILKDALDRVSIDRVSPRDSLFTAANDFTALLNAP